MIFPTDNNHKWIYFNPKNGNKTLIYSRIGQYNYFPDNFFENYTKKILEHLGYTENNDILVICFRGLFMDDKNGNVGTAYIDLFTEEKHKSIYEHISNEIEVNADWAQECDLILNVFISKKIVTDCSDYFSIDGEYQFEKTKKEIFWGKEQS